MRRRDLWVVLCIVPVAAAGEESLAYSINWASGLSLGEALLTSSGSAARREFTLRVDAAVPGFPVADRFRSVVAGDFCSTELEKETHHGPKKSRETTLFDLESGKASRATHGGGGRSEFPIPPCPRDALAFLQFARRELAQGRVPAAQTVFFGASYQVRAEFGGAQQVRIDDERVETDRLMVHVKGPVASTTLEVFFARDAARTPVMAKIPLAVGVLSVDLVR